MSVCQSDYGRVRNSRTVSPRKQHKIDTLEAHRKGITREAI